jgi:hypothetical protein
MSTAHVASLQACQKHCEWCHSPFTPRNTKATGGKPQRFCKAPCREAFHTASRIWVQKCIDAGTVSVSDLKRVTALHRQNARVAPCTLLRRGFGLSRAREQREGVAA